MWLHEVERSIQQLEEKLPKSAKTVLDIGSEGEEYRNVRQPWIKNLYDYLQDRGMVIFTMDLDPNSKATIIHDITQPVNEFGSFDLVLATHLLEHIPKESFSTVITNIESLVKRGGYLIVSVPHKYPYHERPIDNMWRPTWQEIRDVFNGDLLFGETVEVEHALPQYRNDPKCQVSYVLLRY
jgi:SAM-dependent methyltransferase